MYNTWKTYKWEAFLRVLINLAVFQHCLLCGEIHSLRVHAKLVRKIRTGEEKNTVILIISIYCIRAKKGGLQYTKRILPPFVIPECNIILEYVLIYIALYPDDLIDYEEAGFILGTYDDRTISRHIQLARKMIASTNLHLCEVFSSLSSYAHLPEEKTGEGEYAYLTLLVNEANQAAIRIKGSGADEIKSIAYVHIEYVFGKSRSPPKTSLDNVLRTFLFYDIS